MGIDIMLRAKGSPRFARATGTNKLRPADSALFLEAVFLSKEVDKAIICYGAKYSSKNLTHSAIRTAPIVIFPYLFVQ